MCDVTSFCVQNLNLMETMIQSCPLQCTIVHLSLGSWSVLELFVKFVKDKAENWSNVHVATGISQQSNIQSSPVLYHTPRHADLWMSEGMSRSINLGNRWKWVASFRLRSLYPEERTPAPTCWEVDPTGCLDVAAKRKSLAGSESNPSRPVHSLVS
jgi:hypothetical protein